MAIKLHTCKNTWVHGPHPCWQAKKALEFCVENLNADDRFEIVRFSTETFWLSFISDTVSVGTTTCRTARFWPSDTTRCSRLCLTLFSCPE